MQDIDVRKAFQESFAEALAARPETHRGDVNILIESPKVFPLIGSLGSDVAAAEVLDYVISYGHLPEVFSLLNGIHE
jgi:hypothetical protein